MSVGFGFGCSLYINVCIYIYIKFAGFLPRTNPVPITCQRRGLHPQMKIVTPITRAATTHNKDMPTDTQRQLHAPTLVPGLRRGLHPRRMKIVVHVLRVDTIHSLDFRTDAVRQLHAPTLVLVCLTIHLLLHLHQVLGQGRVPEKPRRPMLQTCT